MEVAIRCLGLYQSKLADARRRVWRECQSKAKKYGLLAKKPKGARSLQESQILQELAAELIGMSKASSTFAAVARVCLATHKLDQFIVRDEMAALAQNV